MSNEEIGVLLARFDAMGESLEMIKSKQDSLEGKLDKSIEDMAQIKITVAVHGEQIHAACDKIETQKQQIDSKGKNTIPIIAVVVSLFMALFTLLREVFTRK